MTDNELKAAGVREFADWARNQNRVLFIDLDKNRYVRVSDLAEDYADLLDKAE